MHFPKHLHKIVFTLIVINSITCEGLSPKKAFQEKSNLITKLLDIVNSSDAIQKFSDVPTFNKNGLKKNKFEQKLSLKNIFNNRLLVKRLIPHGYGVSNYEYDRKFMTLYKPLVRVHGGKPEFIHREQERNNIENKPSNKLMKRLRNALYKDEELLQPFKVRPRKVTFRSIMEDVMTYASKADSASDMRRLKFAILEVLENPKAFLRHKFTTGSDERALANTVIKYHDENGENQKPKKKKRWLPDYSFWNYWTYDKTIHQDVCKGSLVHWGNMCIETPPH